MNHGIKLKADAFDQAYIKAKAAVDDDSMSDDEKMKLSNALMEAYNNLEAISQYSVRNAMILPDNLEDEKVLEAELGILDSKHENIVANEYLKMVNGSDYSNGRLINKIKDGNTITIPLNVQKLVYTILISHIRQHNLCHLSLVVIILLNKQFL